MSKFMNAGQTCICPNYVAYTGGEGEYRLFVRELANQLLNHYGPAGLNHICKIYTYTKYKELRDLIANIG